MKRRRRRRADADVDLAELDADADLAELATRASFDSVPALILRVAMVSAVEDAGLVDAEWCSSRRTPLNPL